MARKSKTTKTSSSKPLSTKQQAASFNSASSSAAKIKSISDQARKIQSTLNNYKSNPQAAKNAGFTGINRENDFDEVEAQLAAPQVPQPKVPQLQMPQANQNQTFGVGSVGDLAGGMNNGAYSFDNEELYGDVSNQFFGAGANKAQADALARSTMSKAKAGELPFQTFERLTGQRWKGGGSPEVLALLNQYGIQEAPGSAIANLKLQQALTGTTAMPTVNPNMLGLPSATPFSMPQFEQDIKDGIPTNALQSTVTGEDIFTKINTLLDAQIQTQEALSAKREQLRSLETQALQEVTNARGETIPLGLIGQQEQNIRENLAFRQIPITNEIQALTDQLEADQRNVSLAMELQKMTKPDVIGTKINDETGEVFAFVQDPSTGKVTTKSVGNVGAKAAKKDYIQTHFYRDANNNEVFWGMTEDGQVETKILGKSGVGDGGGSSSNKDERNMIEDIAADMSFIAGTGSRAKALTTFTQNETAFKLKYGAEKTNQIRADIDRVYPAPKPQPTSNGIVGSFFSRLLGK